MYICSFTKYINNSWFWVVIRNTIRNSIDLHVILLPILFKRVAFGLKTDDFFLQLINYIIQSFIFILKILNYNFFEVYYFIFNISEAFFKILH